MMLQQSTARQSLFSATQFELSEAMTLFFQCDNHDVAPCLDDLSSRIWVLELWVTDGVPDYGGGRTWLTNTKL